MSLLSRAQANRLFVAQAPRYVPRDVPSSRLVRNRVDAVVQSSPVTLSASASATLPKNVVSTASAFRISGASQLFKNGLTYVPRGTTQTNGTQDIYRGSWFHSFDFDGPAFEVRMTPTTSARVCVWINEQPHTLTPPLISSIAGTVIGTPTWLKVTIPGSRTLRRVSVELVGTTDPTATGTDVNWNGLNMGAIDSIAYPAAPSPVMCIVGDSIDYGTGASDIRNAWPTKAAWLLGIDQVFTSTAQPSTGLVAPSTNYAPFGPRFTTDVLPLNPDILVIKSSINDGNGWPANQGLVGPALTAYITTARAALPAARIIVTGPIIAQSTTANNAALRDEVKAAALAAGVPFIDTMDAAVPLFYGTGQVGATLGNGNADVYCEAAAPKTHPNDAGLDYLARWMAGRLAPLLGIAL